MNIEDPGNIGTASGSSAVPLTFRERLSAFWASVKQRLGFSSTRAAMDTTSAQPPSIGQSSLEAMAAAARARNPELAGMTRRQKVDRIEQNLRETQATLDRKLAQLGPDTSSINRAVLQKAKAKVEEALRKMDGLPSGDALNQLKEGSSNLSEISSTLDQAMASSREVARLLTLQDSANVSVLIGQLLRSATGKALSDEPLSRGEIHNFSSQIDAILTGPLKGKTGNPIYQGLTVLKEGLDSANPPSGKDFWDALVGLNSLCAQANADIVKLQAQTV